MSVETTLKCMLIAVAAMVVCHCDAADNSLKSKRAILTNHINTHFAEQLTDPQKKKRRSYSQFGYNLSFFTVPMFAITEFIDPHDFGKHSYGKPDPKEKNGSLYTCRGGFMDFSHIRPATDWTVYLTFKIITGENDIDLPNEGGKLHLHIKNVDQLSIEDIVSMAQKIAFERLVWHEVVSWHHHPPNFTLTEQQSTFTPEDNYSNLLGTYVGRNVALRILNEREDISYSQIVSEELEKVIASLDPLNTVKGTMQAYDIVDQNKQMKLPVETRNSDVWWDSKMLFRDERYVFKRDVNIGPKKMPWLVPNDEQLGCPPKVDAEVLDVPQRTAAGKSFYNYYDFNIQPDSILFYRNNRHHKQLHETFASFSTRDLPVIVQQIDKEMEKELLPGFETRNNNNPVAEFKHVRTVLFK